MNNTMKIVLASESPRRKELLERFGIKAECRPAHIDETVPESIRSASAIVKYLSNKKAAASRNSDEEIVIAADTLVFCGEEVLGKPKNIDEARRMMNMLSGKTHKVISGICVMSASKCVCESVCTKVSFRTLTETETEAYIATADPYDKAGGYGIQSLAGAFVSSISGDYYNVVGLPVARLLEILRDDFGYDAFSVLCRQRKA